MFTQRAHINVLNCFTFKNTTLTITQMFISWWMDKYTVIGLHSTMLMQHKLVQGTGHMNLKNMLRERRETQSVTCFPILWICHSKTSVTEIRSVIVWNSFRWRKQPQRGSVLLRNIGNTLWLDYSGGFLLCTTARIHLQCVSIKFTSIGVDN